MDIKHQLEMVLRGTEERDGVIPGVEELADRLAAKRCVVKFGVDPTKPKLHLGHKASLDVLRRFQECGHEPVLLIGGFTAQIGDPSGRKEARRQALAREDVEANAATFLRQAGRFLDLTRVRIVNNRDWFESMTLPEFMKLKRGFTLARWMEHETYRDRWERGTEVYLMELDYPFLQAYDSVWLNADIELGGNDQRFNIARGRDLQRAFGQPPQLGILYKLLNGPNGQKMAKTEERDAVTLDDPAHVMFGKLMRIGDADIYTYLLRLTEMPASEIDALKSAVERGTAHPMEAKMTMAREVVAGIHGLEAAREAEEEFDRVFRKDQAPELGIEEVALPQSALTPVRLLQDTGLASSKGEARRMLRAGAVRINGVKVTELAFDELIEVRKGTLVQIGKRKAKRIAISA